MLFCRNKRVKRVKEFGSNSVNFLQRVFNLGENLFGN